ncbi:MAG: hypothetical protein AB7E47_10890 [Desulfovibrionaceae bacterium]
MNLVYITGLLFLANCVAVADAALLLPLTCALFVFSLIRLKMRKGKTASAKPPRLRMVVNNTAAQKDEAEKAHTGLGETEEPVERHFPSTPEGRRKAEQAFLKVVKGRGGGDRLH